MSAAANAYAALATVLSVGDDATPVTYTALAKVSNLDGPKLAADTVETQTYGSNGFKEKQGTLVSGTVDLELVWTSETTQEALLTGFLAPGGPPKNFQISYPAGMTAKKMTFKAVITKFEFKNPLNGVYGASLSLDISGSIAYA